MGEQSGVYTLRHRRKGLSPPQAAQFGKICPQRQTWNSGLADASQTTSFSKVLDIWGQHTYCQWNVLESGARVEEHQNSNTQRGSKHLLGSCAPPCMCTGPALEAPTKLSALHWDGHFRTTAPGRWRPPWPAEQGHPVSEAVLPEEHPSPSQPLWWVTCISGGGGAGSSPFCGAPPPSSTGSHHAPPVTSVLSRTWKFLILISALPGSRSPHSHPPTVPAPLSLTSTQTCLVTDNVWVPCPGTVEVWLGL